MKMVLKTLVITLGFAALVGCSEGGQLNLINPNTGRNLTKSVPGSEFVSSSAQFEQSLTRQYKVQQSLGSFSSKMVQTSTPSGYKLYYSVQGSVISDEL